MEDHVLLLVAGWSVRLKGVVAVGLVCGVSASKDEVGVDVAIRVVVVSCVWDCGKSLQVCRVLFSLVLMQELAGATLLD